MSEPKRLHPISAVYNLVKQLKDLVIPLSIFLIFGTRGDGSLFYLLASSATVGYVLVTGIISWLRYTYRMEDGELRIEYGILVRKKRYIPFERIQSLDLSEGILHRPFGLVKVKVETAGSSDSSDAEAVLTAVSKEEAKNIQDILTWVKNRDRLTLIDDEDTQPKPTLSEEILYKITSTELLILASTSGGVGVVISAVLAFFFQFEEIIPYEKVFKGLESFISGGIIFVSLVVFIGLFLAWVIAVVGTMLKYADFTVKKVGNDLIITKGLLERRQLTIPLNRIQAIRMSENIIRQPLGFCSVFIESAGGSAVNMESSKVLLLPIIKKTRVTEILKPYLTDYHFEADFMPVPKRAIRRYIIKGALLSLPFIVVPIALIRPWGYLSLILMLVSVLWFYLRYRAAGWSLADRQLTLRYRNVIKHTVFMRKNKIQSLSVHESLLQRKISLATLEVTVKSGSGGTGGKVIDLDGDEGKKIFEWYSRSHIN